MSERRYDGPEIEEIFRRATERDQAPRRALDRDDGLTLAELQEIGREVGIAPARVADAASALGRPSGSPLPLSVSRTVPLPREPTDEEWERLVADLRATFRAAGRVHRHGGLKGWTNGNLHAFVEPAESGYRLRMGSMKESARAFLLAGGAVLALATILLVVRFFMGGLGDAADGLTILALLGLGSAGAGALQLPGWARTRRRQMEEIGQRLRASMEELPPGAPQPDGT